MTEPDQYLTRVFALAAEARSDGNHPFGALLVIDGVIVAEAKNAVNTANDITAHAEMLLVRQLQQSGRIHLLGRGVVYASCEPCPMCVGALFWAGVRDVAYGLSARSLNAIANERTAMFGFTVTAQEIGANAVPPLRFVGPSREDEATRPHQGYWR